MIHKRLPLVLVSLLIACGGGGDAGEEGAAPADTAAAAPGGAESMIGAAARAQQTVAIAEMRSHLNVIQAAGGDEIPGMVPQHRQMTENLITTLSQGRAANPSWDATVDSLRQDLGRMQGMTAAELEVLIDAHADRL